MKLNNSLDLDEFIHGSMMLQGGLRGAAASALHLQWCFLLGVCTGACTAWLWRCSFLAMGLQTEKITCHQLSLRAARWVGTRENPQWTTHIWWGEGGDHQALDPSEPFLELCFPGLTCPKDDITEPTQWASAGTELLALSPLFTLLNHMEIRPTEAKREPGCEGI